MQIKIVVETKCGLERTIEEANRVLMFRGRVVGYLSPKFEQIHLMVQIADDWKLEEDKLAYLKNWIPAKFKVLFNVVSVEPLNLAEALAKDANILMLKS